MKITLVQEEKKYILIDGTHIGEVNKKLEHEFLFEIWRSCLIVNIIRW